MARPHRKPVPFHVRFLFAGAVDRSRLEPEVSVVGRIARNALGDDRSAARYIFGTG